MNRRWVLAGVVTAAGLVAAAWLVLGGGDEAGPESTADRYLAAWSKGDHPAMARLAMPDAALVPTHEQMRSGLRVRDARFTRRDVSRRRSSASVEFAARVQLEGLGEWQYAGALPLERRDGAWRVVWSTEAIHPELHPGMRFGRSRVRPERALILGADDRPLTQLGELIAVGVEPQRVRDRAQVKAALQQHAGVDPARVDTELDRPGVRPDFFVPFAELRPDRYAQVRPALAPVPGIVFRRESARLTPSEGFSRHVVGRMGEITAEQLKTLGPRYQAGDSVGRSGLEAAYEKQLAGTPSGEVRVLNPDGSTAQVLHKFTGSSPAILRTSLAVEIQTAADRALDGVTHPAALVAVDTATSAVLAAASRPLEQPFNRAFAGRFPPGSTFKVVTTAALLRAGVTAATPVPCPAEIDAGGRRFHNFESAALGTIPFAEAFRQSCNTAFVDQAGKASREDLARAAEDFGFGAKYDLGMPIAGGTYPAPRDATEHAAAAIGQGRVEASPLHMATVAAAVASGRWTSPDLLVDGSEPTSRTLDPAVTEALRQLMRAVVQGGTGASAAVRGRDVSGKTGTAEFGTGNPPPTHAWFIGFEGNVAFAVLVEGGGVGGRVAAPIASRFVSGFAAR